MFFFDAMSKPHEWAFLHGQLQRAGSEIVSADIAALNSPVPPCAVEGSGPAHGSGHLETRVHAMRQIF